MTAKTSDKPADVTPTPNPDAADPAAELEAVRAELAAAKAELAAAPKPAAPKSKSKASAEKRGTHTLLLGNGELVQTDAPSATEHYGKDGRLHPVVNAVANPPAEEV